MIIKIGGQISNQRKIFKMCCQKNIGSGDFKISSQIPYKVLLQEMGLSSPSLNVGWTRQPVSNKQNMAEVRRVTSQPRS